MLASGITVRITGKPTPKKPLCTEAMSPQSIPCAILRLPKKSFSAGLNWVRIEKANCTNPYAARYIVTSQSGNRLALTEATLIP